MRCARTTPPPPKLTVRATLRGNVSTAHASVAAGSAPESAAARSLTSTGLSIGSAVQVAQLDQAIDHPDRTRAHVVTLRVDHQLRRERLLVGVRNARELGDLAGQRAGVQALGVAAHALLERRLHVHFDERADLATDFVAHRAVGRDRRADHHHAVAGEQLRDVADAADVGVAVLAGEAEALGEILAYLVAVERLDPDAGAAQLVRHGARERGLAGPRQTGEPERESARLRDAALRRQRHRYHFVPPLHNKKGPLPLEAGPRSSRACRSANRASSHPGSHSATTASAPRGATHPATERTTVLGGAACDHGWVFTPRLSSCQPRDRVVDSVAPAG